jgi:acyl-CoA hydrolase
MHETRVSRIIKSEDLNHHGTLYAGRMAEWLVEACLITTINLTRKPEDVVCVRIHGFNFRKPARTGDVIEIRARVAYLGGKSITVSADVYVNDGDIPSVTGMLTFVTVDRQGMPYNHGLTLPKDYIEKNRDIYEAALAARNQR